MADTKAESIQDQDSMTIAAVAEHIGKTSPQVTKLIDSGILTGIKLHNEGHRRVTMESFVRYCNENRINLPVDSLPPRKVIFVIKFNYDLLKKALPPYLSTSIELVSFKDLERAIANIEKRKPSLILMAIGNDKLKYYDIEFGKVSASHPLVKFAVVSNVQGPIPLCRSIHRIFNRNDKEATYDLLDYIASV